MEHLLITPNESGVKKAAELIKSGDLVAFPTETVYGLGANALNEQAVRSIFIAKGRPLTDPLIVHIAESKQAYELIELNGNELRAFDTLIANFWPGPLTLIVKASPKIPLLVTADTGFVGVRQPNHPLAVALLAASGLPIAAPSANRFGHVSPTTALHVLADLGAKGVHVLNGEHNHTDATLKFDNCEFGIESSVVKIDAANEQLIIFRQGAISQHQLEQCLRSVDSTWKVIAVQRAVKMHSAEQADPDTSSVASVEQTSGTSTSELAQQEQEQAAGQQAPGQAITHYAPDVPCFIVASIRQAGDTGAPSSASSADALTLSSQELASTTVVVDFNGTLATLRHAVLEYRDLSSQGSAAEAARALFDTLRWSEQVPGASRVLIAAIPLSSTQAASEDFRVSDMTLGLADRIFRAASGLSIDLRVI